MTANEAVEKPVFREIAMLREAPGLLLTSFWSSSARVFRRRRLMPASAIYILYP
jgi:hypothetical protein